MGRDVESMVRDLLELTVNAVRSAEQEAVKDKAWQIAEERMLDLLLPKAGSRPDGRMPEKAAWRWSPHPPRRPPSTREKLRKMLQAGKMDSRYVDLDVADRIDAHGGDFFQCRHGGDGHQFQGYAGQSAAQEHPPPKDQSARSHGDHGRRKRPRTWWTWTR